ncbi:MAG TPA: selenobiotic family peptide radical SAM maturase [Desulfobacteraceae bacterium]|nr:selenobiotic family peptide radical SAM maturase [Desulfobacteraceae bacterium]
MVSEYSPSGPLFPACRRIIRPEAWDALLHTLAEDSVPEEALPNLIAGRLAEDDLPPFVADLAAVEARLHQCAGLREELPEPGDAIIVNPTLSLLRVGWRNLPKIIERKEPAAPEPGEDFILIWQRPADRRLQVRSAASEDLLALKLVLENLDKREIARLESTTLARLDRAVTAAVQRGILLAPPSAIRRDPSLFAPEVDIPEKYLSAQVFTLQWHITQACDLRCKHCYDRSDRSPLSLEDAVAALDQLYDFCQARHVYGQVSFSGGNPLLHPHFFEIYRAAADRGFMTAILGNPTTPEILSRIIAIQKPEFFQVSLEGLREHNDHIRGAGFFDRVLRFLDDLRAADIYSMVMLTLTRGNLDQVLPLAEQLRDKVDLFTFNRLSMVGEGAQLLTPGREEYEAFLHAYLDAKPRNPCMGLKDSLINIIRSRSNEELFGGCAGMGCGAAFNFVALLPDGQVHACRKFPSLIGNIHDRGLADIYDSPEAARYRLGPDSCRGCRIRHVCGGCLAVIDSAGLDWTQDRDPCCFIDVGAED